MGECFEEFRVRCGSWNALREVKERLGECECGGSVFGSPSLGFGDAES